MTDVGRRGYVGAVPQSCGHAHGCALALPGSLYLCPAGCCALPLARQGWGAAGAKGLVSCALPRLKVQLRPRNKTSLSRVSEQPKPELMEQTGVKGEGFCLSK